MARVNLLKLTRAEIVQPLLGWWLTSSRRKNWQWPMYCKDLSRAELEQINAAWESISGMELPVKRFCLSNPQADLPEMLLEAIRCKSFSGDPPTKKSFSDIYPAADLIEANADYLLSDLDPVVKEFVDQHIRTYDESDLAGCDEVDEGGAQSEHESNRDDAPAPAPAIAPPMAEGSASSSASADVSVHGFEECEEDANAQHDGGTEGEGGAAVLRSPPPLIPVALADIADVDALVRETRQVCSPAMQAEDVRRDLKRARVLREGKSPDARQPRGSARLVTYSDSDAQRSVPPSSSRKSSLRHVSSASSSPLISPVRISTRACATPPGRGLDPTVEVPKGGVVDLKEVSEADFLKIKFAGNVWRIGERWSIPYQPVSEADEVANESTPWAVYVVFDDGRAEKVFITGAEKQAMVAVRRTSIKDILPVRALSKEAYKEGLFRRALKCDRTDYEDLIMEPIMILYDANHLGLDADICSQFGSLSTIISSIYGTHSAGDLFFVTSSPASDSDAERVDGVYVSVAFACALQLHGTTASGIPVVDDHEGECIILAFKVDRFGAGKSARAGFHAIGGVEAKSTQAKMFAIPLRSCSAHLPIEDKQPQRYANLFGPDFWSKYGAAVLQSKLFAPLVRMGDVLFNSNPEDVLQNLLKFRFRDVPNVIPQVTVPNIEKSVAGPFSGREVQSNVLTTLLPQYENTVAAFRAWVVKKSRMRDQDEAANESLARTITAAFNSAFRACPLSVKLKKRKCEDDAKPVDVVPTKKSGRPSGSKGNEKHKTSAQDQPHDFRLRDRKPPPPGSATALGNNRTGTRGQAPAAATGKGDSKRDSNRKRPGATAAAPAAAPAAANTSENTATASNSAATRAAADAARTVGSTQTMLAQLIASMEKDKRTKDGERVSCAEVEEATKKLQQAEFELSGLRTQLKHTEERFSSCVNE